MYAYVFFCKKKINKDKPEINKYDYFQGIYENEVEGMNRNEIPLHAPWNQTFYTFKIQN